MADAGGAAASREPEPGLLNPPPELAHVIFSHLDTEARGRLAQTSHRSQEMIDGYRAHKELATGRTEFIEALPLNLTVETLKTFLRHRYDANSKMPREKICGEIAALLAQNHSTTILELLAEAFPAYFTQTLYSNSPLEFWGFLVPSQPVQAASFIITVIIQKTDDSTTLTIVIDHDDDNIRFDAILPHTEPDQEPGDKSFLNLIELLMDGSSIEDRSEVSPPANIFGTLCLKLATHPRAYCTGSSGSAARAHGWTTDPLSPAIITIASGFLTDLICYPHSHPCVLRAAFTDLA